MVSPSPVNTCFQGHGLPVTLDQDPAPNPEETLSRHLVCQTPAPGRHLTSFSYLSARLAMPDLVRWRCLPHYGIGPAYRFRISCFPARVHSIPIPSNLTACLARASETWNAVSRSKYNVRNELVSRLRSGLPENANTIILIILLIPH